MAKKSEKPLTLAGIALRIHKEIARKPRRLDWLRERLHEAATAIEDSNKSRKEAEQAYEQSVESWREEAKEYFEQEIHKKDNRYLLNRDLDPSIDARLKDLCVVHYGRALSDGESVPKHLKRYRRARTGESVVRNLPGVVIEKKEKQPKWEVVRASDIVHASEDSPNEQFELRISAWAPRWFAIRPDHDRRQSSEFRAPLPPETVEKIGREYKAPEISYALAAVHDGCTFGIEPIVPRDTELSRALGHKFATDVAICRREASDESASIWNDAGLRALKKLLKRTVSTANGSEPLNRDEWLYRQAGKSIPWKAIWVALNTEAKSHEGWEPLKDGDGVRKAVKRYVSKNRLPPLPPRKRGAIKKTDRA